MSIEKITSKILSDAENQSKILLDDAKSQADGIIAEATQKADEIVEKAQQNGAEEKKKLISRRKAVADIDGRKIVLQEKQQLIGECFDKAIEKITSMKKEDYLEFIVASVKNTGVIEGELILNQKDRDSVGMDLIGKLNSKMPGSKFTLSEEMRNIRGGFLLRNGSVYINGTIESLINEAKEELVGEVAKSLFQ